MYCRTATCTSKLVRIDKIIIFLKWWHYSKALNRNYFGGVFTLPRLPLPGSGTEPQPSPSEWRSGILCSRKISKKKSTCDLVHFGEFWWHLWTFDWPVWWANTSKYACAVLTITKWLRSNKMFPFPHVFWFKQNHIKKLYVCLVFC
jgi:hypothetical protein